METASKRERRLQIGNESRGAGGCSTTRTKQTPPFMVLLGLFRSGCWKPENRSAIFRIMARQITLDASPPVNRWMKDTLVKDAFRKTLRVLAAQIPPAKTGSMLKAPAMRRSFGACHGVKS